MRVLFDASDNRGSNTHLIGGIVSGSTISTGGIYNSVTPIHSPVGNVPSVPHNTHQFREMHAVFTPRMTPSPRINCNKASGKILALNATNSTANSMIGDVGEPLWVQLSHPNCANSTTNDLHTQSNTQYGENKMPFTPHHSLECYKGFNGSSSSAFSAWSEPDEISFSEAKKVVTQDDKKIFWEMTKTIIELPEISEYCNCSLRNASDLSSLLRRPEFKILWTADAADILPKHTASDLVTAAYMHCTDK